jgi:Flp pilus assembly protein TadD
MVIGGTTFAHDPLREDDEHDHDIAYYVTTSSRPDIARVRSLVLSFRETGDDRELDEAWTILEPALEGLTDDPETLIAAAFVAQSRHDFRHALQLITRALSINANNDEGWLLLASIHLVRGEAEQAAQACARLRHVPLVSALTCHARVAVSNGDHALALARLQGVLRTVDTLDMPAALLAWSYNVAGDLAVAAGETKQALENYRQSLGLAESTQARAAMADVLLDDGNDRAAWEVLDAGAAALPLLVRRLIIAKRCGRLHELQPELAKVEREFDDWIAKEDWLHAREMTRFFIDVIERPVLARRLALINIGLQQEPEDLRLERRTRPAATSQGVPTKEAGLARQSST